MGIANGQERAFAVLSWSTAAPASSPGVALRGHFNLTISGTFTGLLAYLERSFDAGATWHVCTIAGEPLAFGAGATETPFECEAGVLYRVRVEAIASGTVAVRLSQ